jgi:glycosyltransferase involved in cell wall biosynthesis
VDTDELVPRPDIQKRHILWVGQPNRHAKGYDLWCEVIDGFDPSPYTIVELLNYTPDDYWAALDSAAVLVNTSRYESFCSAIAEARAKGVPVLHMAGLHGPDVQEDAPWTVADRAPANWRYALHEFIDQPVEERVAMKHASRDYALANMTLKHMHDDIADVYREVTA